MTQVCAGCAMEGRGPVRDRTEQWLAAEVAGRLVLVCAGEWREVRRQWEVCSPPDFAAAANAMRDSAERLEAAVDEYVRARAALDAPPPKLHGDRCPTCGMPR